MHTEFPIFFAATEFPIGLLVVAAIFVIKFLIGFAKKKNAGNDAENALRPTDNANDRVRQIREEIARRMAEKNASKPTPARTAPPPPALQTSRANPRPPIPTSPAPATSIWDQQSALLEELEKAKKSVLASQKRVEALLSADAGNTAQDFSTITVTAVGKAPALAFLKNKDALRTSIVVREILSQPLSLRSRR